MLASKPEPVKMSDDDVLSFFNKDEKKHTKRATEVKKGGHRLLLFGADEKNEESL